MADEELLQDLACNLLSLRIRQRYRVFLDDEIVLRLEDDGLFSLDLCMLVFQYFQQNGLEDISISEVLQLYYVFSGFLFREYNNIERKNKNILLISRNGYYVAKNLSEKLRRIFKEDSVKIEPIEYMELFNVNLKHYDLLFTDFTDNKIRDLKIEKMDIHYFRTTEEINNAIRKIMEIKFINLKELFKKEDLYLNVSLNSVDDLYMFLEQEVLGDYERKEDFLRECKEREMYFPSVKKNQMAVLRSIHDCIGESIIKIIVPAKPFEWAARTCRMVFLYNVKDNAFAGLHYMNNAIANIIHDYDFLPDVIPEDMTYKDVIQKM